MRKILLFVFIITVLVTTVGCTDNDKNPKAAESASSTEGSSIVTSNDGVDLPIDAF